MAVDKVQNGVFWRARNPKPGHLAQPTGIRFRSAVRHHLAALAVVARRTGLEWLAKPWERNIAAVSSSLSRVLRAAISSAQ
jgi:hypothetical protein